MSNVFLAEKKPNLPLCKIDFFRKKPIYAYKTYVMDLLISQGVIVMALPVELALHEKVPFLILGMKELKDPLQALYDLPHEISQEHPSSIVLGGFGATGCPSLTHHPEARAMRDSVYSAVLPSFAASFPGRRLEVLADRFGIRRKGSSVSAELWHRDVGPKADGDIIYGGWVNLDPPGSPPQYFSCIPGNILPNDVNPLGFAKFPKTEHAALEKAFKITGKFAIPPGHIIIFNQSIAHKITGSTAKMTTFRQYFGWRITDRVEPVYDKESFITKQSMPPLPSGQIAPTYAKLHLACWRPRLVDLSTRFREEFVEKAGKKTGIVYRELPGLVEAGLPFPAYTPKETAMFYPILL